MACPWRAHPVVWRYRDLDSFQAECPGGDSDLQREIVEKLDDGIAWLRALGADVVWEENRGWGGVADKVPEPLTLIAVPDEVLRVPVPDELVMLLVPDVLMD